MPNIGSRLPSPYYEWIVERKVGASHFRKCAGCGHGFTTVEVPLFKQWAGGRADCCPNHPRTKGEIIARALPNRVEKGQSSSLGVLRVYALGGAYRRRQCSIIFCKDELGKRTRWTTAEFLSEGTVVKDVSECPKCGGRAREKKQHAEDLVG